jgi:Raf kinase inhibitor-like YbhB/YbcL family protein
LSWSDVPAGTGSLVLVVADPDAPSGVFRHWAVFDIPPASRDLDAGYSANLPIAALHQARNDFGKPGYSGPCPPQGVGTHHYHFRLLAISRPTLDLRAPAAALEVLKAAQLMSSSRPSLSAPTTIESNLLAGIAAGAEYVMPTMLERAASGRSASNNLPLVRVGLIELFLLDKNRPDSRNGCDQKAMRLA